SRRCGGECRTGGGSGPRRRSPLARRRARGPASARAWGAGNRRAAGRTGRGGRRPRGPPGGWGGGRWKGRDRRGGGGERGGGEGGSRGGRRGHGGRTQRRFIYLSSVFFLRVLCALRGSFP